MQKRDKLLVLLDKLIEDGNSLVKNAGPLGRIFDEEKLRRWSNELILFKSLAGDLVKPWTHRLNHDGKVVLARYVEIPLSILRTIRFATDEGLLVRYEDLVNADVF